MAKFQKAGHEKAYLKVGFYGEQGSGKTLTSLLLAEGLALKENKRIAYIDTEKGTKFYSRHIAERAVHPDAFDFDRIITASITETLDAVRELNPNEHGVLVIDSITTIWDAARDAYNGPRLTNGAIPIQKWGDIKRPYKQLMRLFLDGDFHAIICGREGLLMEKDEETGESEVIGKKMKAEGETSYEPDILVRMRKERVEDGTQNIRALIEKDRSGILQNKIITYPNFATFEPIYHHLSGDYSTKLGSSEEIAEHDAQRLQEEKERQNAERIALFDSIKTAVNAAMTIEALKSAWSLTTGKKTKLGEDLMTQLESVKDARKVELMKAVA